MRVMVLNDGETFTDLAGCRIVNLPDDFDGEPDGAIKAACEGDDTAETEGVSVLYTFNGSEERMALRKRQGTPYSREFLSDMES
jgi:hypothetical protein